MKHNDFGTHEYLSLRGPTLILGPSRFDHRNTEKFSLFVSHLFFSFSFLSPLFLSSFLLLSPPNLIPLGKLPSFFLLSSPLATFLFLIFFLSLFSFFSFLDPIQVRGTSSYLPSSTLLWPCVLTWSIYHVPCVTCLGRHPTPVASKNVKFRPSRNSTKFDWVIRFRETISTVKSVSSSEI